MDKPYAIVIGLDCITGLQTARILAARDVPVLAIAKNPAHFCCRTKVCQDILTADTGSDEFVRTLELLGPELQAKAVLFPCTDMSVLLISQNRHRLQKWYHVILPEPEVVEKLMNKISFYTYAQEAGLPVPGTFFLKNKTDALNAADRLTFPCILKPPIKTPIWEEHTKAKVYKVSSRQEFLSLYDQCSDWADILMVQEWVAGPDANLFSCNCYFSRESQPFVTFIARKIRQWPPETGTSCLGEEIRNDEVLAESIRLFQSANYKGLGYVEMKRDDRNGKHYIIEPNIGRPTGRSAISEAGGVELLYTMYCDAIGLPIPENRQQKYEGVKWIYLRHDLQSALYYWRRGELSLKDWWRSWRGNKFFAVFSWKDPSPFFYDLIRVIGLVLKGGKRARQVKSFKVNSSTIS